MVKRKNHINEGPRLPRRRYCQDDCLIFSPYRDRENEVNKKLCLFALIVITLSLFAGSRTVQRSIFTHSISHCQPRNRVPQTLTAAIRHVYNLFCVDHKVPDVDTGYHCIFTISLISFIQVCDCEDSAACAQESRKCDLKARTWNA